jgi:tetratricopeptide (TPR) repeat protein
MTNGDTPDSARRLAIVDAQRRARQAAVTQLQQRTDVKDLRLTQLQAEAFTAVVLDLEEAPPPAAQSTRAQVEAQVHGRLDGANIARKMALLRKDQDVTFDLVEAWTEMQAMHRQLVGQTQRRARLSNDEAAALTQAQLRTLITLEAKHLSARALAAFARTEPSTFGGRVPSDEGRDEATRLVEKALALAPDSVDAHSMMGDLLVDAGEPEAAEAEYRKALLADPDSSSVRTRLAEALRLQGQFAEAIAELREAIRIEPGAARAHAGLALALQGQENHPETIAEYREAIRLDPDLIDAHNGLAVVLARQGRRDDAVVEFREIIRIDPDSTIGYYNLAYVLADLDRDVESAAALREVIRINPNHYNARYNLGELFRLEGKYDDSVKQFREYLRLAPDAPQNRRNIERAKGFIEQFAD